MSDGYWAADEDQGFSINYFEERGGKASSGITATATCFGCTIPIILIICGAILISDPTNKSSNDAVRIVYLVVGILSTIGICCQLCCISMFQVLICCKCFKDIAISDSDSISSKVIKDIGDNLIQTLQWCLSCWNLVGPIVLIACSHAIDTPYANEKQIGTVSIIFGCLIISSYVLSCLTVVCAQCLNICCVATVSVVEE